VSIPEPLLAADLVFHNLEFGTVQDRYGFAAWARTIGDVYPDFAVGIDGIRFDGGVATIRLHEIGRQTQRVEPSAAPVFGIVIMRVINGRIAELWSNDDEFGRLHEKATRASRLDRRVSAGAQQG
jgi:SnoaL-like domain